MPDTQAQSPTERLRTGAFLHTAVGSGPWNGWFYHTLPDKKQPGPRDPEKTFFFLFHYLGEGLPWPKPRVLTASHTLCHELHTRPWEYIFEMQLQYFSAGSVLYYTQ